MFVDTIVALTTIPQNVELALNVFQGSAQSENFESGELSSRFFRNAGETYEPRVTFWTNTRTLRVEFSVPKMVELSPHENVSETNVRQAFDLVDTFLAATFGVRFPPVNTWRCQRVDYAVNFQVGELLPAYMSALSQLQVSSLARHPFGDSGIVWKSRSTRGRWIKFYDKSKEALASGGTLRFEVSNFRDSVRYMAERWFACERSVGEMVKPGRVAFVLSYFWSKLGLTHGSLGTRERELVELRQAFGSRSLAGSAHALNCIRVHGVESYKSQALMSKSSYYRWLRELRSHGFLGSSERALPALSLPLASAFAGCLAAQNLKGSSPPPILRESKKIGAKKWETVANVCQINPKTRPNVYLMEQYYAWRSGLDHAARAVPQGGEQSAIFRLGESAVAGVGA